MACFKTLNFSDEEVKQIFGIVIAILHLGNIEFDEQADDEAKPTALSSQCLHTAARLLRVDPEQLTKALTKKEQLICQELITSALTPAQADQAKNALAKHIYTSLFNWLVKKVNQNLGNPSVNC